MKKYLNLLLVSMFATLLAACAMFSGKNHEGVWELNSVISIGGFSVEPLGSPKVIQTSLGKAVSFDGDGDRLLVNANPLGDATEFTIEIIFKPNDVFPNNKEPCFFHIESADNTNRRITFELRLNDKHQWYSDTYIKSEKSQLTLIDAAKVHPIGKWANGQMGTCGNYLQKS